MGLLEVKLEKSLGIELLCFLECLCPLQLCCFLKARTRRGMTRHSRWVLVPVPQVFPSDWEVWQAG